MSSPDRMARVEVGISEAHELASKSRRALLLAVAFGCIGATLLMLYLHRFEEEVSGGGRVPLLTVLKPIARGTLVSADMLTISEVPLAYVEQRAVRSGDRSKVIGVRTANALAPQDTLLWSDLALSSDDRDLSSLVQPGKRAVTVRASESGSDPAGNGLVRPGDYVDVIVTLRAEQGGPVTSSVVLLQRVLVLAVGSDTQAHGFNDAHSEHGFRSLERELTLSLKVEEVQLLSLARERGTLSVALRSPTDSKVIESVADLPASSLFDKAVRETVQHHAVDSTRPVRVSASPR
ncbi:MAG TPA: Flp pilus assembly protein CpaB [Polyangiales bacterium]